MTDDRSIYDLSAYGNQYLKILNLDNFHEESVSLTDFIEGAETYGVYNTYIPTELSPQ